jgi:hypothetical protein
MASWFPATGSLVNCSIYFSAISIEFDFPSNRACGHTLVTFNDTATHTSPHDAHDGRHP